MSAPEQLSVCQVCQGDPRAALTCTACHGAGASLLSPDGYLVWSMPLDGFTFSFRRLRRKAHAIMHLALAGLALAGIASLVFTVAWQGDPLMLTTRDFWQSGHWYVTTWWLGWLLGCFLLFRVRVFSDQAVALPTWGKTRRQIMDMQARVKPDPDHPLDIAPFFQTGVWDLLEYAYDLARRLERADVEPVHLFAAALTSTAGGVFMTRLGLTFDQIRPALAELVKRGPGGSEPFLSLASKQVLLRAYQEARTLMRHHPGVMEIFLQAFAADAGLREAFDAAGFPPQHVERVAEWIRLQEQLKDEHDRFALLAMLKPKASLNRTMTSAHSVLINQLGDDLTASARAGLMPPLIGRERELEEIWRVLESGRRAVVLIGEAGVGKTALLDEIARRMVEEDVPESLFDQRLVALSLPQILSSGDLGQATERLLTMLQETAASGNIVLAIEGIEALAGLGLGGGVDLAELLATQLERLNLPVIATTTPQAWTTGLERRTLGQRLAKINLPEVSADEAIRILMARTGSLEYQNNVFFTYAALDKAVSLAGRYLRAVHLPQSALEVAKEAAVLVRREHGALSFVGIADIARVIHEKTNIPVEAVTRSESDKLLHLEEHLHGRVIGQAEAVQAVAQAMRRARAEIRENKRPIANFLFLGPTGVGKTELAKALAAEYFGNEQAMIRLDMSEYQDPASTRRVIGAPGDERGGLLTEAVRTAPFSIVLLDELEKAHPDILTLFLQVMDDGRLTDGVGRTVDFTNVVLIATSNAGTAFIQEQVQHGARLDQIKTALMERELHATFRPEFLNRFDGVIVFKPLTLDDVQQIAWLLVNAIGKRLEADKGIIFRAEDQAVESLARDGFDPLFGARPLRRVIQARLENGLADLVLRQAVKRRDTVTFKADGTLEVTPPATSAGRSV